MASHGRMRSVFGRRILWQTTQVLMVIHDCSGVGCGPDATKANRAGCSNLQQIRMTPAPIPPASGRISVSLLQAARAQSHVRASTADSPGAGEHVRSTRIGNVAESECMKDLHQKDNRRILVVDDNEAIHADFRKILSPDRTDSHDLFDHEALVFGNVSRRPSPECRFPVETASQGQIGLRRVEEAVRENRPYAVAFVDMQMPPGWDGVTTIEHLWQADPDLQVVICTAYSDHSWTDIVDRLGRSDQLLVVKKPFDPVEILQASLALTSKWNLTQAARHKMAALEAQVRTRTFDIQSAHEETIQCLSSASMYRDKETGAHIRRTGLYCAAMGRRLGWSEGEIDAIRMTAPMHDVGKIGIPDAILLKPGPLTDAEFEIMKSHTIIGARLLVQSASTTLQRASEIALNHHERWDGLGYPRGVAGTDIPLAARMLAVADAFDAMTHDRVYRSALSCDGAIQVLRNGSGTQFDPALVDLFLDLLPEMRQIVEQNPDGCDGFRNEKDIVAELCQSAFLSTKASTTCNLAVVRS